MCSKAIDEGQTEIQNVARRITQKESDLRLGEASAKDLAGQMVKAKEVVAGIESQLLEKEYELRELELDSQIRAQDAKLS